MSPIATEKGLFPVAKSTLAAKLTVPLPPVLRSTDTVLSEALTTARSGIPSPSKSPIATEKGVLPVAKSTLGSISAAVMLPLLGLKVGKKKSAL